MGLDKKQALKKLEKITNTIDLKTLNLQLEGVVDDFQLTNKTLRNIAEWALDGKSETEIRNNLELSPYEWEYLKKQCPSMLLVMQHSYAYADIVVAGTLLQTALGGQEYEEEVPIKKKMYEYGKCVGEEIEIIKIKKKTQANPYLLKFLAENKLSENFGDSSKSSGKEHKDLIDAMTEEERKAILEAYKNEGN